MIQMLHPDFATQRFWQATMTDRERAKAIAEYSVKMADEVFVELQPLRRAVQLELVLHERRPQLCRPSIKT